MRDTRNTTYQGFKSQTNSLIVALSGALSFAEPEDSLHPG